jgi:hypothetical protein
MLIRAYGMFWEREEVNWLSDSPGGASFRLLGHCGTNRPKLRVVDFARQAGLYVLYNDYGAYYVGLTTEARLGYRLRDHTRDKHHDHWDRFCWFGFRYVLKRTNADGTNQLRDLATWKGLQPRAAIADMEAALIMVLNPKGNMNEMRFHNAERWDQVRLSETTKYLKRVAAR